ncbi:sporulation sigma-E factor-processing peptidase [Clostridia bacterium]|nr:sporulation sigma-E factor-processing peptidase [Clostridia bacterium]
MYIDVLLCVNLIINYFILLAAGQYTKIIPKQYRLILGSSFGAICSLVIFMPKIPFILNFLVKIIIAAAIVFISFGIQNKKTFLKNIAIFFLISFCFCGIMIAVWFIFTPKGMLINNSVVYFNISPVVMVLSSVICYFIFRFISKLSGRETPAVEICKIKIINNGTYTEIYGKVDTGNSLAEPFSGYPVIVADRKSIEVVTPKEVLEYLTVKTVDSYELKPETSKNIRLIPFNSVGGQGILPSFIPQEIYIDNEQYTKGVFIAICSDGRLTGECKAMVNPQIINH